MSSEAVLDGSWQGICVKVLPLFNGDGVRGCMEDLNDSIALWIKDTPAPHAAEELMEMMSAGMLTLTSKLSTTTGQAFMNAGEEHVLACARLAELWTFFYGTVLPYLAGVFLPVKLVVRPVKMTDMLDVRNVAMFSFRDYVVIPMLSSIRGKDKRM